MNFAALTTTEMVMIVAVVVILAAGTATTLFRRTRPPDRLRSKFGGAEYARAVEEGGNRRIAEAGLDKRTERVENFHLRLLGAGDRARFVNSWRRIQSRFVDGPASAVAEADQLLGDVMSTRGYPVSEFAQRAADISVDHPLVLEHYRTAHDIAIRQTKGEASTEALRQAMIHYRSLLENLVAEPDTPPMRVASWTAAERQGLSCFDDLWWFQGGLHMLRRSALAAIRPDARQDARGRGVNVVERGAAGPAAQRGRRDSSGGYLRYLLCTAGRHDLLTTRHLHDRHPPEMPPMC